MIETTRYAESPCVIHYVDVAHMQEELRPVCGAWGDEVTWTTLVGIATCPACASALRQGDPGNRSFRSDPQAAR